MKNIKAIIFDAYGTLFDVNSAAEKCKDKIGDKWEGFANYWRTTQLEYTWLRSLMKRHKDFWQVTEDSLDKSMKAYKMKKTLITTCAVLAFATPTFAGGLSDAMVAPEVIAADTTSSSSQGILVPIMALLLLAAAS